MLASVLLLVNHTKCVQGVLGCLKMKNKIVRLIIFFIPTIILFSYYIKKNLTNLFSSDIFEVDFSDNQEEEY